MLREESQEGALTLHKFSIHQRNSEDKVIENAELVMTIEPSGYEPYLSISNSTIQLPIFLGKDARTGEVNFSIIGIIIFIKLRNSGLESTSLISFIYPFTQFSILTHFIQQQQADQKVSIYVLERNSF